MHIPKEEYMVPGNLACAGCGSPIGLRFALKALGEKTVIVIPASCMSIIVGGFPYSAVGVPILHVAFATAACSASGIRASLDMQGDRETTVVAWAGDGGTFDIGIQALSGAAERNDDFIYICSDNEAYMNTGIQRSSATPYLAWTTTTPVGNPKERPKKDIMAIMADHGIPYAATACVAYPEDFIRKLKKAKGIKGTRFIHLLSPCPAGWRIASDEVIRVARLAVETKVFSLYEIQDGEAYTINYQPKGIPVEEYLNTQGRFRHLTGEEMAIIQENVDHQWSRLLKRCEG
ncbi:MAG: 3-methyl-2-oxobutanoate dehydrogenase subunit beta [Syntrophobacterales bacterium]|nr:MAG: 3-methyl-2-oxobutanoate dehydrogenase subunit beta [Syntrophobacterales bacterium]